MDFFCFINILPYARDGDYTPDCHGCPLSNYLQYKDTEKSNTNLISNVK